MMSSAFTDALKSGKFVVTTEVAPPKGTNLEQMRHHIDLLKDRVDAMNVTDHQSSVMRFPSLGGALLVREAGGEPILQMTCRDRNRMALQADLLFAASRGIRNVLCLTGDSVVRVNPQGDIELRKRKGWEIIGGLLGDYERRVKRETGLDWA